MVRGFIEFEGFDPRSESSGVYRISRSMIDLISRRASESKLNALYCVKNVVENPKVAFRGLRTVDEAFGDPRTFVQEPDSDGLCVASIPQGKAIQRGGQFGKEGFTFAVFVDARLTVLDWDWIRADRDYPHRPIGWGERFDELIWSTD